MSAIGSSLTSASVNQIHKQNSSIQLAVRSELFEHGVYPQMQNSKITPQILINTFTNLNLLSSIDYKIKLQPWVDQAIKHIPGMTEADAAVYFQSYRTLLSEIDGAPGEDVELPSYQVDVRCFGLFIALQLYSSRSKMNDSRQNLEQDPWGIKESTSYGSSVNSSPRIY